MIQGNLTAGAGEARAPGPGKVVRTFQRTGLSVTFPHWESHTSSQGLLLVAKKRHFIPFLMDHFLQIFS